MPSKRDQPLIREIGARLQRVRMERGWTQERLGEAIGVEAATLSRAENGHRMLGISALAAAARALGVGLGDLLDEERPIPEPVLDPEVAEVVAIFEGLGTEKRRAALRMLREIERL